jgi:glycosyltransferase involved in cell wall biosynthesis
MKGPSCCGESCLFRNLDPEAFPLHASGRSEAAWVTDKRVIRIISGTGNAAGHPLYSSREPDLSERRALLKELMDRSVAHVAQVTKLCGCSFETPFLEGVSLIDLSLSPDENRPTYTDNGRPVRGPEALPTFLGELASGLVGLHEIGIAHGDPALMNALVVREVGGTGSAIWADVNTFRPATEENRALDAAGFIEFCLWPCLLEGRAYSPLLFAAIAHAVERSPNVLAALSTVLAAPYTDYRSADIRAAFAGMVRSHRHWRRMDLFGEVHRTVQACMAPAYFLDQSIADPDGHFGHSVSGAGQTRRRLREEEAARLHNLRLHDALQNAERVLAELREWSKQLQEAAQYHERQAAGAERQLAAVRSSRTWRLMTLISWWVRRLRATPRAAGMVFSASFSPRRRNLLFWAKAYANGNGRRILRQQYKDDYYMAQYPDIAESGIPGILHYICTGYLEGRNPSETFDLRYYMDHYSDVAKSGIHPLLHYALFGAREGRFPSRQAILSQYARHDSAPPVPAERVRLDNEWPADVPLVSVVIPCFNYGAYVADAIESVLKQTFQNFELIVIEGGSTDGVTPQRLRELELVYPRVTFVFRSESHLAGDNRNFGIQLARGRYICCLDADDALRPTYLEVAVFLAERYGYDLVYPSVQCFGQSEISWLLVDASFPEIAAENQVSTVALLRKAAWETVGGFRDWGKGGDYVFEDWDFWLRIVGGGFRAKAIREPLMLYRVHGSSLTTVSRSDREHHRQAIANANRALFESPPRPPREAEVVNTWANLGPVPSPGSKSLLLALPFLSIGGAEKLLFTLVQGLVERGYHVSIITTIVLPDTMKKDNGLFDPLTASVYHLPELFPDSRFWPEFIHYLLRRYAVRTLLMAGCEFVYHMLPDIDRHFPDVRVIDQLFNDTGHIANNRYYKGLIDLNIVPSQALANTLIDNCGEDPEKVKIIPHGVAADVPTYRDSAGIPSGSGLPARSAGKFLVSFFGRLSEEKSPRTFVEIARRLSSHADIDFCLTGEGPERAAVLELISRYRLEERIFAPGFVPDVRPLIAASDVVVVPSRLDGMPLIVLESQMFGKPVVGSAVGSLPEMIADGLTGFLCPVNDVAAFCARIEELHAAPGLCRQMGERARAAAVGRYDAGKMVSAYIAAFESPQSGIPVMEEAICDATLKSPDGTRGDSLCSN